MSSKTWGIVGAIGCFAGYQLLKYGFGKTAGYVFAGLVVLGWVVIIAVYRRRLARLRQRLSALSPEERSRALEEMDPGIRADLKKNEPTD